MQHVIAVLDDNLLIGHHAKDARVIETAVLVDLDRVPRRRICRARGKSALHVHEHVAKLAVADDELRIRRGRRVFPLARALLAHVDLGVRRRGARKVHNAGDRGISGWASATAGGSGLRGGTRTRSRARRSATAFPAASPDATGEHHRAKHHSSHRSSVCDESFGRRPSPTRSRRSK